MQKEAPGKGRFERSVFRPGGIKASDLGRFDDYVREKCQGLLDDLDNWISKLEAPDENKGDDVVQTGVGIYHYVVHEENVGVHVKELLEERSQ